MQLAQNRLITIVKKIFHHGVRACARGWCWITLTCGHLQFSCVGSKLFRSYKMADLIPGPNYTKIEGERLGSWNYLDSNGFAYLRERERDGNIYLRCKFCDRKNREGTCDGRGVLDLTLDHLRCTKPHQCTPSPLDFEVLKAKNAMKKAAASSSTGLAQVHRSILDNSIPEVASKLPILKVLSTMKAARRRT